MLLAKAEEWLPMRPGEEADLGPVLLVDASGLAGHGRCGYYAARPALRGTARLQVELSRPAAA